MPEKTTGAENRIEDIRFPPAHKARLEPSTKSKSRKRNVDSELDRAWSEWETTFDAIQDPVMLLDRRFNIIQANAATAAFTGKPLDQIIGNRCCQVIHNAQGPPDHCPLKKADNTKKRCKTELYLPDKDAWAVISVDPILDQNGELAGAVHIIRDITERKRSEAALRESEEHFRNIFDNAFVGLYKTTPDGRILIANPALLNMLGYDSFEELAERNLEAEGFEPEYSRADFKKQIESRGQVMGLESAWTRHDGSILHVRESAKLVRDNDGKTLYYEGTVEDITEQKKAKANLVRQTAVLNSINHILAESLTCKTEAEVAQTCLAVAEELSGSEFGFIIEADDTGHFDIIAVSRMGWRACKMPDAEKAKILKGLDIRGIRARVMKEERSIIFNDPQFEPDWVEPPKGHPKIASFLGVPLKYGDRTFGMIGLANKPSGYDERTRKDIETLSVSFMEVLVRKRNDLTVERSEQRLQMVVDSAGIGTWDWDLVTGNIVWGGRHAKLFGLKDTDFDARFETFEKPIHPEDLPRIKDAIETSIRNRTDYSCEYRVIWPDGTTHWIAAKGRPILDSQGKPVRMAGIVYDITGKKRIEKALIDEKNTAQKYLDVAGVMMIVLDKDGKIKLINKKGCEILGFDEDEILGKNWFENFLPESQRKTVGDVFSRLMAGEIKHVEYFENPIITKNGDEKLIAWHNSVLKDENGNITGTLGSGRDVTDRRKAENALRESEKRLRQSEMRYRSLFESMLHGFAYCRIIVNTKNKPVDWVYLEVNDAFERLTGFKRKAVVGRQATEAIPGIVEAHPELFDIYGKVALTGKEEEFEIYFEPLAIWLHIFAYSPKKGFFVVIFEDITQRKKAQKELLDHQAQLKTLTSELALAEERERRRIAAGIHDDVGQKLAMAKLELQMLRKSPADSSFVSLENVCRTIDKAIENTHSLTFELSNPALYELNFAAAIEQWLFERIEKRHGIKCKVRANPESVEMPPDLKVMLFQAIRELAVNVVKYANANTLRVNIKKHKDRITITVEDDGVGFDPAKADASVSEQGGFGLFNIRQRLEHIDGSMKSESAPAKGAKITLTVPLEK
ncbi:MAG: PAS domain S-box protein [Sedimentisphaerales bacterium]|nr:PAS domain S-box protein [Sedimentisphaerales bacterium]